MVGRTWQKTGETNPQVVLAQLAREMQAQQVQQTQQQLGQPNSALLTLLHARQSLTGGGGTGLGAASQ